MLHQSHVSELISAYETRRPDQLEEEVKRHLQEIALEEAIPPAEKEEQPQTVPQTISGKPIKPPLGGFHQAHADLVALLQHPSVSPSLLALEEVTGLARVHFAYGLLTVLSAYLVLGHGAWIVSYLVGFAYPAYASYKAIRTKSKDDDTQWLIYWCAYTAVHLMDSVVARWASVFPGYWVLKTGFLVYLWLPQFQGALLVYSVLVDPAVTLFDEAVKKYCN